MWEHTTPQGDTNTGKAKHKPTQTHPQRTNHTITISTFFQKSVPRPQHKSSIPSIFPPHESLFLIFNQQVLPVLGCLCPWPSCFSLTDAVSRVVHRRHSGLSPPDPHSSPSRILSREPCLYKCSFPPHFCLPQNFSGMFGLVFSSLLFH